MNTFLSIHQNVIHGHLSMYDRMIFKGHLNQLMYPGNFTHFLQRQGVLLKDFKSYVTRTSEILKQHAQHLAQAAGRRYQYLDHAVSHQYGQGKSKEDLAQEIAQEEQIIEGLICVFSTVEKCHTFSVRKNEKTGKLEPFGRLAKCLHFYFYYLDPEFGLIHIRLQSWFPFQIQIYLNGREWLARQLDQRKITYQRYGNCFTRIADLKAAQDLSEQFAHKQWPGVLQALAKRVNPLLGLIQEAHFGSYYWVVDQCEYATDLMFTSREALEKILPDLFEHAILQCSAEDVLSFLGRKLHGNFTGEVTSQLKKRRQGWRVKHSVKRNSIKMYDKWSVLRVETTINNPNDFKVSEETPDHKRRWKPMGKGVANLWRYVQVSQQANQRYLDCLGHAQLKSEAVQELDDLCRCHTKDGKRFSRFNPLSQEDSALFQAILAGEFALRGFRNHDVCSRLYPKPAQSDQETKQHRAKVSRLIAKLRAHGLVAKVKDARLYRITERGYRVLLAILRFRKCDLPLAFQQPL